jgi:hypothetical protein
METREIARAEWTSFFDAFSRQHDAWLVTVQAIDTDVGARTQGWNLRFRGLTWDPDELAITLSLEAMSGEHLTHIVQRPTHVLLEQLENGVVGGVQLQSADAANTVMRFRSAVPPEAVDGISPGERP